MIYLVTQNPNLVSNEYYTIISVSESLHILHPLIEVGLDTETTGLNCHKDKLLSLQLGCYEFQVVIDCTTINILEYKDYLESDRVFIGHNLKFDLKWLFKYKIVPKNIYDTYLGELVLWNGYPISITPETYNKIKCDRYQFKPGDGKKKDIYLLSTSLQTIAKLYLGIDLDKSIRGQIIWKGLSDPKVIVYAADDVKYMKLLKDKQLELLTSLGLEKAVDLLNRFEFPVAYMEFCGVRINTSKWREKMIRDQKELDQCLEDMNKWLVENDPNSKYVYVNLQGNLFTGFDTSPKVSINWNSPKQVIPLFKKFGVNVIVEEGGDSSESINAKALEPQSHLCSLIPLYLKYKEQAKLVGTYGNNVLTQIDEETGRLYTKYNVKGNVYS